MNRNTPFFHRSPGTPEAVRIIIQRRARFSEIDALAIVWHGRYAGFFEEAQTELGRKIGITYHTLRKANLTTPVASLHIDYIKPLYLDEPFTVEALLYWPEGPKLQTEYILRNENGEAVSRGYTIQLFVTADTQEVLWFTPDLLETCMKRWEKGEFHV